VGRAIEENRYEERRNPAPGPPVRRQRSGRGTGAGAALGWSKAASSPTSSAASSSRITAAIAAGGPVYAIDVCTRAHPQIAARLSQESGAQVGRTALSRAQSGERPDGTTRGASNS